MRRLTLLLLCASLATSCNFALPTATPPPGWRSPVSNLLVDDSAFPKGWFNQYPEETQMDPTINHVGRIWGHMSGAHAEQGIWRAYTLEEARDKYDNLRRSQFQPHHPADTLFLEFKPPAEITFRSEIAHEFYLACGWNIWPYCEVVARYRNYIVDIRVDHQAEINGMKSVGLTYQEIETVVQAMDNKFTEALDSLPTPSPEDAP